MHNLCSVDDNIIVLCMLCGASISVDIILSMSCGISILSMLCDTTILDAIIILWPISLLMLSLIKAYHILSY